MISNTYVFIKSSCIIGSPDEITKEVKRTLLQLNGRPSVTPSIENGWRLHGRRPEEFAGFPPLEDEDLNFNNLRHITSVSEVIVYYKDDGRISLKVALFWFRCNHNGS